MNFKRKNYLKVLTALLFTLLLSCSAFAAGTVKIQNAASTKNSVTLYWNTVAGATGYRVYSVSASGAATQVGQAGAAAKSYTIKNLKTSRAYRFYVTALDKDGEGKPSATVSVATNIKGLEKVKGLSAVGRDKMVKIRWTKNKKADGYVVYKKESNGTYTKVGSKKAAIAAIKGLKNGKKYTFAVAAYRKSGNVKIIGVRSADISCEPVSDKKLNSVHMYYTKGYMTGTYKTGGRTFKKGQSVTIRTSIKQTGKYEVRYKGKSYKIPTSMIRTTGYITNSKKSYSKKLAEQFVNAKGYSSKTKYFIWISTYGQHVYVFKGSKYNWKIQKKFLCSTGMFKNDEGIASHTPHGIGRTGGQMYLFKWAADQYAYYCINMIPGGWFHSWLYHPDGTVYPGVGTIGEPASHGCVRLGLRDSKWLYDHIPANTTYVVY